MRDGNPHNPEFSGAGAEDDDVARLRAALEEPIDLDLSAAYQAVRARIARDEANGWSALRARPTALRWAVALGLVFAPALATSAVWLRTDLGAYSAAHMAVVLSALAALSALSLWLSLRPVHVAPLPPATNAVVVLLGAAALSGAYLWTPAHAGAARAGGGAVQVLAQAWPCLFTGVVIGLPVYLVLRLLDRGGTPHAALLALTSGLCANAVLQLHCPAVDAPHLMLGHLGVVAALLALYGLLAVWSRRRPNASD